MLDQFFRASAFGEKIGERKMFDVGFRRDRNPLEVSTTSYVARMNADAVKKPAIIWNAIVCVLDDFS